jgi:hypothetical protein
MPTAGPKTPLLQSHGRARTRDRPLPLVMSKESHALPMSPQRRYNYDLIIAYVSYLY